MLRLGRDARDSMLVMKICESQQGSKRGTAAQVVAIGGWENQQKPRDGRL